jgi:putative sugar O-methyltransferase
MLKRIKERLIKQKQGSSVEKLDPVSVKILSDMFKALELGDSRARPSKYWVELNKMNMAQLQQHGYENFKRTIALNYFTFARILPWDAQFRFLLKHLTWRRSLHCLKRALTAPTHEYFSAFNWIQSLLYNFLTIASWEYTRTAVIDPRLLELREPEDGSPASIRDDQRALISQDLANSILEVSSIGSSVLPGSVVVELGAGYGRDAYALMMANQGIKYVIIDIPPALWVAETYLRKQFPSHKIFTYREFDAFEEIADEFQKCDIAFFLSTQIAKLPDKMAEIAINISSLHEMRLDQIKYYFAQFDRLLKDNGLFYFKQWKRGVVPFENVVINQEDYPIPDSWCCELSRESPIQTQFFEARYRKSAIPV